MFKEQREWDDKHNNLTFLDENHNAAKSIKDGILFIERSRIAYAATTPYTPYFSHIREFWNNARLNCEVDPPVIESSVKNNPIQISEQTIRDVWRFGDSANDPKEIPKVVNWGCLLRMKYAVDLRDKGGINKGFLPPVYKYIADTVIHVLVGRKGGYDDLPHVLLSALTALILNKPFNFSGIIFDCKKDVCK